MDIGSTLKNAIGNLRRLFDEMLATIQDDQRPSRAQKIKQRIRAQLEAPGLAALRAEACDLHRALVGDPAVVSA